jgi:hypothetical protein
VGMYPEQFDVVKETEAIGTFANNDIVHIDAIGANHDKFSFGLKKSLFNYMHGICFDYALQDWFEFKVPRTKIQEGYIYDVLQKEADFTIKPTAKVAWMGGKPYIANFTKTKKGRTFNMASLTFHDKKESFTVQVSQDQAQWLEQLLLNINVNTGVPAQYSKVKESYEAAGLEDFELFWFSKPVNTLRDFGLLVL